MKKTLTVFLLILGNVLISSAQRCFVENKGQWDDQIEFRTAFNGQIIYLKSDGFSFLDYNADEWSELMESHHHKDHKHNKAAPQAKTFKVHYHHYQLNFLNQSSKMKIIAKNAYDFKQNFFLGNDQKFWASNVNSFAEVIYQNLYNNIDLQVLLTDSSFKYNFILHEGANLNDIKIDYQGLESIQLKWSKLHLKTSLGTKKENIPISFYTKSGEELDVRYRLDGTVVGFKSDDYNGSAMVLDPEVVFATYAGNSVDNFGFTATYDSLGSLYGGGISTEADKWFEGGNGSYPTTLGAFDRTYNGGQVVDGMNSDYSFPCDITINKYSPDGKTLIYATYIGGLSNEYPHSLVVDDDMNLVILGSTFSSNYPTSNNAFQAIKKNEADVVVTKLSKDGDQLIGSTFLGGNSRDGLNEGAIIKFFYADNFRGDVITDTNGNVYAAMHTKSLDFPVTGQPFQSLIGGKQDGVVFKLNYDLSNLEWSSFLGGEEDDALYSIDLGKDGNIYVSGGTRSKQLKSTVGTIHPTYMGGSADGFIAVISDDGKQLIRSTYWGGNKYDQIFSLDLDDNNDVYIVGQTFGGLTVVGDVYQNPGSGQFIAKMDDQLKNLEFQTLFGTGDGFPDITINAFLVDECQKIFVSGWGGETSTKDYSSTRSLPITKDAYQKTTDGSDFYLIVLAKNARELLYGTYFGGSRTDDHVDGGTSRFDKKGVIYQSVCASCPPYGSSETKISDFPTTAGSYSPLNKSPRCSNATFKIAFGNLNRKPLPKDTLITVMALDTSSLRYIVNDPDWDSLFVYLNADPQIRANLIDSDTFFKGFRTVTSDLNIRPDCGDVGDTFDIEVFAIDKGCPGIKDSSATIRVAVTPPPLIDPPETICLNFPSDNSVRLEWDAIPDSRYFKKVILYRTNPNGKTIALDSFTSTKKRIVIDDNVSFPRTNNYVYYLVAINKCDKAGPESYKVSTTKEFESPIDASYMITATVENNKDVKLIWSASQEEDFGNYDIYRKANNKQSTFVLHGSTYNRDDTTFLDTKINVQKESYCYAIVVNDNCGHVSARSNVGCNIVLEGETVPWLHTLNFNPYYDWSMGVNHYELKRSVDTGSLWPYDQLANDQYQYEDRVFDYDWGGYWYEIEAYENTSLYNATSRSNKVYLIQPPLLHVPNAFTSNFDNLNDAWGIVPVFVKTYELNVFNRWGERVFYTKNKKEQWDGTYKGKIEPNSVYIYTITYTGWDRSVHRVKGTVTILR